MSPNRGAEKNKQAYREEILDQIATNHAQREQAKQAGREGHATGLQVGERFTNSRVASPHEVKQELLKQISDKEFEKMNQREVTCCHFRY